MTRTMALLINHQSVIIGQSKKSQWLLVQKLRHFIYSGMIEDEFVFQPLGRSRCFFYARKVPMR
ncbi:hypothetical protein T10_11632 [Trichinella papuae]|uniref:Uncharacterized protein n=1 Tax=Trichinella papuae TaxID=268474 RepID=A0A0V1MAR8_9BILA|nr:hypothetical protein T10_11632 [Trichinella papuae]